MTHCNSDFRAYAPIRQLNLELKPLFYIQNTQGFDLNIGTQKSRQNTTWSIIVTSFDLINNAVATMELKFRRGEKYCEAGAQENQRKITSQIL